MNIFQRRLIMPDDIQRVDQHLRKFEHRYGEIDSEERIQLLKSLLANKVVTGLMLEKSAVGSSASIVAIGITGFLDLPTAEKILAEADDGPVVDRLYAQELDKNPVILRPAQVAQANTGEGLALMFLHFSLPAGDPHSADTQQALELMQSSFRLHHGGYHCRLALHPVPEGDSIAKESLLRMGFQTAGNGRYLLLFDFKLFDQVPFHPFTCLQRKRRPVLGFSVAEKELLNLALWGNSDAVIADTLHISLDTVRKRWRRIYQRVDDHPDVVLFPDDPDTFGQRKRGPAKRNLVMQYIDTHLEEIRPYLETKAQSMEYLS